MTADKRGQGLALVIILTAFILTMGSAAVVLASSLHRNSGLELRQKKAYYIAEAGVEKAIFVIRSGQLSLEDLDPDPGVDIVPEYISPDYAGGSISHVKVFRERESENVNSVVIIIEGLGSYQGANCKLQARIKADRSLDLAEAGFVTLSIISWKKLSSAVLSR